MNMPDWVTSIDLIRPDETLVVTSALNGLPYHVTKTHVDYPVLWELKPDDIVREVLPPPPTPEQVLTSLPPVSHAQMVAALIIREIITEAEGVDWIKGTLPAAVEAMIAALPEDRQIIARLRAIRPTNVVPTDPLVTALAMAQGKTTEDMVELFELANSL